MKKYADIALYIIFGALTTLVNVSVYNIFYGTVKAGNAVSVAAAWFLSVAFAFFTNRKWVFKSGKNIKKQAAEFFLSRAATGIADLIIMLVTVDILGFRADVMKLVSNVIVIALNYILSRLWVFGK